ncbi:MAG: hypothetical protein ACJ8M4_02645 [Chthoniobacterales bacterium]
MLTSYFRRHGLAVGLSLLVLFKLWLVHTEDIYASATEYDALWYVTSAKNWYWGAQYSWTAFVRPPSYPLFIALIHLSAIPLRIAIELLQLSAYLVIVHALRKVAVPNRVCLVLFAAMALHPASFQLNNYTMSDCFYAAILPLSVGGLLLLLFTGRMKHALWTGLALGALWNAREESFLIPFMLATFVGLAVWQQRIRLGSWKNSALAWLKPVGAMLAVLAAIIVAVNTANYRAFQSFTKSDLSSASYKEIYNALLRIKPDALEHYVAISSATLEKAYTVSPTFAQLRPQFEGDLGRAWAVPATAALGQPQFGPWIMWAIRSVAANTDSIYASPASANGFFRQAAKEINEACDTGQLACRSAPLGFLDPGAFSFLNYLPQSMARTATLFARAHQKMYEREDATISEMQRALYDEMTGRRPGPPTSEETSALTWSGRLSISFENIIGNGYRFVVMALAAGAVIGIGLLAFRRELRISKRVDAALLVLAATVLIRFLFFSFLDATWWTDDYERYLFPVMPLSSALFVLIVWKAFAVLRTRRALP